MRQTSIVVKSLAMLGLLMAPWTAFSGVGEPRRFEVRDAVEMSYFGTLRVSEPNEMDDDGIISPDGRLVVKVTHRGVLPEGVTEGTIWLFDARAIKRSLGSPKVDVPAPIALARMSAGVNGLFNGLSVYDAGNIIFQLRWTDDSQKVTFLGRNGRNNRQLFQVDLATHDVRALTPDTQDVLIYAPSGRGFVYFAGADADVQNKEAWWSTGPDIPDIAIGTGTPLMPLLYPHFNGEAYSEPVGLEVWQAQDAHDAPVIDQDTQKPLRVTTRYDAIVLSPSPNATQLATIGYRDASSSDTPRGPLEYQIINLINGATTSLGAPIARPPWNQTGHYQAAWSADGTQIALSEIDVPSEPPADHGNHSQRCTVGLADVSSHAIDCILPHTSGGTDLLESLHWNSSGNELLARYKRFDTYDYRTVTLRRRGASWITLTRSTPGAKPAFQLRVRESLNEPPVLVATDPTTNKAKPIFDPNPQLARISLGSVSVYEWKDSRGRAIQGGLVKPPGYVPGQRYPLVIQTHGFDPKRFFTVGFSTTANAGRALAARNLIVLQVHEPSSDTDSWRDAMENGTDVYLSAIDQLAAEGVIDPKRVGISGYSYSGWLAATSITRAPDRFAAAEIANTDPVTLMGYFTHVDSPVGKVEAQAYVGSKPYGAGLQIWADRAPGLATDKITAPVLFQAADPWHLLSFWEMYAGMRDQGKPVELQYIRGGQHIITKPLHQIAHQQMLVDWFDFWLNGHEDPDAGKTAQYARWRRLKETHAVTDSSEVR